MNCPKSTESASIKVRSDSKSEWLRGSQPSLYLFVKKSGFRIIGDLFASRRGPLKSQTELHQASPGRASGRILPGPRGRGAHPASPGRAAWALLPSPGYLVEMRVPGDIVPPLLQRHGARRAGLGVAASGGSGGRPAPHSAAGPAGPESQPRAGAQRGAHGPGADLARGDTKVRGPFGPARTRARPGTRARGEGGGPAGAQAPPSPAAPRAALAAQRRGSGLGEPGRSESKLRKQIRCGRQPAPRPPPSPQRGSGDPAARRVPKPPSPLDGAPRSPRLLQPTCAAPGAAVYAAPLRGRRGETLRGRYPSPANGWTAPAAARARKRVRPARRVPKPLRAARGFPGGAAQPRSLASAPTVKEAQDAPRAALS